MSRYTLMPLDALEVLTGKKDKDNDGHDVEQILQGCEDLLEGIENKEYSALNPQDLILMLASSLKTTAMQKDELNDRVVDFLWSTVAYELKAKGVLRS